MSKVTKKERAVFDAAMKWYRWMLKREHSPSHQGSPCVICGVMDACARAALKPKGKP